MTEAFNIIYSPEAVEDLKSIYEYIKTEFKSEPIAFKQTKRIREKILSLNFMPHRHSLVDYDPWHSMKIRKILIDNYIAFYLINDKQKIVTIIRILYAGRNTEEIAKDYNTPTTPF